MDTKAHAVKEGASRAICGVPMPAQKNWSKRQVRYLGRFSVEAAAEELEETWFYCDRCLKALRR
jgi:hypothetical protein